MPTKAQSTSRSSWAGISPEDRRAQRRGRLVDAAFELLGTKGYAATTVRAVCQHAQLNPRYFYESFLDLDALLVAAYNRTVDELAAKIMTAMGATDNDPRQQAHAAIKATVRFVDDDRRRGRVLYAEGLGNEALNRRRLETGHALVDVIDRDAQRQGYLAPGETIGRIGASILVGGFSELLVAWLDGRIKVSRERLVQDATALFLALGDAAGEIAAGRGSGR